MIFVEDFSPLREIPFVAFDFETTGLDPREDQIIEVGMALFQGGEFKKTYHQLVDPRIPISDEAFKVHGISNEMLTGKILLRQILHEMIEFLEQGILVAHNIAFDFSFLIEALRKENLTISNHAVVDSCELSRRTFPEISTHRLDFLAKYFGFGVNQSHRALDDAKSCLFLLEKIIDKLPNRWETSWGDFSRTRAGVLSRDLKMVSIPEKLSLLENALLESRPLIMVYLDVKGKVTEREITPVGFSLDNLHIVLVAYCHLRKSTRNFRIDRILELKLHEGHTPFSP